MAAVVETSDLDSTKLSMVTNCNDTRMDESASSEEEDKEKTMEEDGDGGMNNKSEEDTTEGEEGKKEEEEENHKEVVEKKERKKRSPKKKVEVDVVRREGGRERKTVERFSIVETPGAKKANEQPVDAPGKGTKLGDIPFIADMINKTPAADLTHVYHWAFGKRGKQTEIKKHLRTFSGFPFDKDSTEFEKRKITISRWEVKHFKQICNVMGLHHAHNKDEFVSKLLDFGLEPEDNGRKPKAPKKRRSSSSKKVRGKGSKGKGKKAGKSSPKKRKHDSDDGDESDEEESDKSEDEDEKEPPKKRNRNDSEKKHKGESDDEEESEEESEPEVDSEEEKKKKKKKPAKRLPKKSPRKPLPVKMKRPEPRKDKSESENEKESEDDEENEGPVEETPESDGETYDIGTVSEDKLKKFLKRTLKGQDLETVSMKMVLEKIRKKCGDQEIGGERKAWVKSCVDEVLKELGE